MYYELIVNATDAESDIWLVDENGHPVQKATGTLNTRVLSGKYFIEFWLESKRCYSIELEKNIVVSQLQLESLGTCSRPTVRFPGDKSYVENDIP
jgi:hypothetical protein